MRAHRKLAEDRAVFQNFSVELLVFLWVADVDASSQNSDRAATDGKRALMRDRVNSPRKTANDNDSTHGKISAKAFRHLRTVERRLARTHDAETRRVQDLHVALHVQHDGRIVNLQERLRIFGFGPIDDPRRSNSSQIGELSLRALKRLLLDDGLCRRRRKIASLEPPQRGTEDFVG